MEYGVLQPVDDSCKFLSTKLRLIKPGRADVDIYDRQVRKKISLRHCGEILATPLRPG